MRIASTVVTIRAYSPSRLPDLRVRLDELEPDVAEVCAKRKSGKVASSETSR